MEENFGGLVPVYKIKSLHMTNLRREKDKLLNLFKETGGVNKTGDAFEWEGSFPPIIVTGRNGSGKSSIKEAIIFALTGRDSSGGQAPTHLISDGEKSLKVVLMTNDWGIESTLTQKKNGTIKIITNTPSGPFSASVSQTDRMKFLGCSEEVALSAILPGYLMSRPVEKRYKLFSEILTKCDRNKLVAELSGRDPKWIHSLIGDLNEPTANLTTLLRKVTESRLQDARELHRAQGSIAQLTEAMQGGVMEEPSLTEEEKVRLYAAETYVFKKKEYTNQMANYFQQKSAFDAITAENKRKQERAAELVEIVNRPSLEITLLSTDELEKVIASLRNKLSELHPPIKPGTPNLPSSDSCPTCGQVVGIAHRKAVEQINETSMKDYEKDLNYYHLGRRILEDTLNDRMEELKETKEVNLTAINKRTHDLAQVEAARKELSFCNPIPVVEPKMPDPIEVSFTEEEIQEAKRIKDKFQKDLGAYDAYIKQMQSAKFNLSVLQESEKNLTELVRATEDLEKALRDIPEEELKRQRGSLDFGRHVKGVEGLKIEISEESFLDISLDGVPYECLSTGEKMKIDFSISASIHDLLSHKQGMKLPRIVFIDNADLISWGGWYTSDFCSSLQKIYTYVKSDEDLEVRFA